MLANTPVELRSEMVDRINSSHKNQINQSERSDGSKVLEILRKAMKNDGHIERRDIDEKGSEAGFAAYISPPQGYWNMTIISAPSSPVEISKR